MIIYTINKSNLFIISNIIIFNIVKNIISIMNNLIILFFLLFNIPYCEKKY